jgi:hypothetical protein
MKLPRTGEQRARYHLLFLTARKDVRCIRAQRMGGRGSVTEAVRADGLVPSPPHNNAISLCAQFTRFRREAPYHISYGVRTASLVTKAEDGRNTAYERLRT